MHLLKLLCLVNATEQQNMSLLIIVVLNYDDSSDYLYRIPQNNSPNKGSNVTINIANKSQKIGRCGFIFTSLVWHWYLTENVIQPTRARAREWREWCQNTTAGLTRNHSKICSLNIVDLKDECYLFRKGKEDTYKKIVFLRRGMKQTSLNKTNNDEERKEENQNLANLSKYLFWMVPYCFLMKYCGCFIPLNIKIAWPSMSGRVNYGNASGRSTGENVWPPYDIIFVCQSAS